MTETGQTDIEVIARRLSGLVDEIIALGRRLQVADVVGARYSLLAELGFGLSTTDELVSRMSALREFLGSVRIVPKTSRTSRHGSNGKGEGSVLVRLSRQDVGAGLKWLGCKERDAKKVARKLFDLNETANAIVHKYDRPTSLLQAKESWSNAQQQLVKLLEMLRDALKQCGSLPKQKAVNREELGRQLERVEVDLRQQPLDSKLWIKRARLQVKLGLVGDCLLQLEKAPSALKQQGDFLVARCEAYNEAACVMRDLAEGASRRVGVDDEDKEEKLREWEAFSHGVLGCLRSLFNVQEASAKQLAENCEVKGAEALSAAIRKGIGSSEGVEAAIRLYPIVFGLRGAGEVQSRALKETYASDREIELFERMMADGADPQAEAAGAEEPPHLESPKEWSDEQAQDFVNLLRKALSISPLRSDLHYALAVACLYFQETEEALKELEEFIKEDTKHAARQWYRDLQELEDAVNAFADMELTGQVSTSVGAGNFLDRVLKVLDLH